MRILKTGAQAGAATALTGLLFGSPVLLVLLAMAGFTPPPPAVGEDGDGPEHATVMLPEVVPEELAPEPVPEEAAPTVAQVAPEPPQLLTSATSAARPAWTVPPRRSGTRLQRSNRSASSGKTTHRPRRSSKKKGPSCADDDRVQRTAPNHYDVAASWVDENGTMKAIGRSAYLAWHENAAGKRDGFEIKKVRCGPLWQIGLRPGDVVHTINDKQVRSLTKAFIVYSSVKNKDRFRIRVTRDGAPLTLHYEIVPG